MTLGTFLYINFLIWVMEEYNIYLKILLGIFDAYKTSIHCACSNYTTKIGSYF